jgi:hypothetical protein
LFALRTFFLAEAGKESGIGGLDRLKLRLEWSRRRDASRASITQRDRQAKLAPKIPLSVEFMG